MTTSFTFNELDNYAPVNTLTRDLVMNDSDIKIFYKKR